MKYAPRKVYIKENGDYVELSYKDFCRRRESDQSYQRSDFRYEKEAFLYREGI
ncbi:hypothetical protein AALB52_15185 [Lachnospiraceae bacterium 38-14]|uniref:hypothetical protein n=1 Tax=Roseburia sp. 1XD42-69 TaxID=2320088 RepID=UPI002ED06BBE